MNANFVLFILQKQWLASFVKFCYRWPWNIIFIKKSVFRIRNYCQSCSADTLLQYIQFCRDTKWRPTDSYAYQHYLSRYHPTKQDSKFPCSFYRYINYDTWKRYRAPNYYSSWLIKNGYDPVTADFMTFGAVNDRKNWDRQSWARRHFWSRKTIRGGQLKGIMTHLGRSKPDHAGRYAINSLFEY